MVMKAMIIMAMMVIIMNTKRKDTSTTNILTRVIVLTMFFSLSHAQEFSSVIGLQAGSLQTFVDVQRGNFSVFDKDQKDVDFMSWLYGGATNPNSYFTVTVDDYTQTIDQMQVKSPFSVTLGSQIDGAFYASGDVLVEVAYFSLDLINTGDFNSMGIILKLSNISSKEKNVGVKFVLDTDIGESHNDPMIYLPSGEMIDSAYIFTHMPNFLLFGEGKIPTNNFSNKGFYLYPYVSEILPSYMVIANWRRIFEQQKIENGVPFSYEGGLKDVGAELRYDNIYLDAKDTVCVGIVISKQQSIASPVLSEDSISKGVFNEDRFKVAAMLNQNLTPTPQPTLSTPVFEPSRSERVRPSLPEHIPSDSMWGYLYRLNSDMEKSGSDIDSKLRPYTPSQTSNTFFQRR